MTKEELRAAVLLAAGTQEALMYLRQYGITVTNFIHDEYIVELPDGFTEEQVNVIVTELKVLFG